MCRPTFEVGKKDKPEWLKKMKEEPLGPWPEQSDLWSFILS